MKTSGAHVRSLKSVSDYAERQKITGGHEYVAHTL